MMVTNGVQYEHLISKFVIANVASFNILVKNHNICRKKLFRGLNKPK